jgi:hypothetical protein
MLLRSVVHAGCAADMGVVDAWERRGSERVTRSIPMGLYLSKLRPSLLWGILDDD